MRGGGTEIIMNIESIDIKSHYYFSGTSQGIDGVVHVKQMKSLSIVQSKIGSYGIKIDNLPEENTGEGGVFIAPSLVTQKIAHHANPKSNEFKMRFVLMDIIINNKYHIDDIFDFPITADRETAKLFDADFDCMDSADTLCDKMSCIYRIIKHLLAISKEKKEIRNKEMYPLTEFIAANYMKDITVADMANFMNMSESNFYAVFKKVFGISPVKYLNDYRMSAASEYLLQTEKSINDIAEEVGISDRFYFSKMFKAKYMVSPMQYRKENEVFSGASEKR